MAESTGTKATTTKGTDAQDTTTKASTFQEAAATVDLDQAREQGYIGTSPEAERTGRRDKGLSQRNPAILNGDPVPDARPQVDDAGAIKALKG